MHTQNTASRTRKDAILTHAQAGLGAFGMSPQSDPWQKRATWRPRNCHLGWIEHDVKPDDVTCALIHVITRAAHTRSREALIDALYVWRRQLPEHFGGVTG
jgi:hypothetical protein